MSVNFTYEFPFARGMTGAGHVILAGWTLNSILHLSDGNPQDLRMGGIQWTRSRGDGRSINDRPDLKPGADNNPVLGGPNRYYDATQFVVPPGNNQRRYFGNLGRNTLISPGYANFDFSLVKNSTVGENSNVQFRAEFFNLLNRPNFGLPANALFTSSGAIQSTAGTINRTVGTSRQIQFGLKYIF